MKKSIYLLMVFPLLMNYSRAQGPSFGFTAGAVFTSYKIKAESVSFTSKTKTGFTAGIVSSIALGPHCSFMPALNFVQKGGTFKTDDGKEKVTLNYVELPLNIVFNASLPKGKFFIGAGPALSLGLSGKDKIEQNGTEPQKLDLKFGGGDDDNFKALEAGVNILAGYQFKGGLLLTANYNAGLNNIAHNDRQDGQDPVKTKYHNRYFGIRIGYMFTAKK